MLTVYIESNLASPLAGHTAVEVNPRDSVREIISKFLFSLQNDVGGLAVFDKHYKKLEWDATIESQGITDGTKLYIGYDKSNVLQLKHVTVIGAATFVIALLLFIVSTILYSSTGGLVPLKFGIVIDAGSTHTEVFLYSWPGNKDHGTGKVHQKDSCEYEVGIANKFDPDKIVSCVNNVTSVIPSGTSAPELYLGATGGMRLLNMTNPLDVDLILMTLRFALRSSPTQVKEVEIIQGEDEALFSWITINFLAHALNEDKVPETYGALDLGGASTQYAYAIKTPQNSSSPETRTLTLYGNDYEVSSKSFLCFGYYEAIDRFESILMLESQKSEIVDPCLPVNLSRELQANSFSLHPCVQNKNFSDWLENDTTIDKLIVNGSSNYSECKKNMPKVLDESICKNLGFKDCISSINLSALNIKFMAFSGFYYVVDFFNASTLDQLVKGTTQWCNLTWDQIKEKVPESQYEHVSRYCFAAVYITELLTTKYGFDSSTWTNLNFTKKVEETEVGWSLGFMINATNAISEESPSSPVISLGTFVPLVIISVFMIFLAVFMLRNNLRYYGKQANLLE